MPTWKQAFPEHKPLKCGHYWHFCKSGQYLAIYDFIGALTAGGERHFFATTTKVAAFFKFNPENTRRVIANLKKKGWLEERDGKWYYISHDKRAKKFPHECKERPLLEWQVETDPLVGQLYALSGGKLRVYPNIIASLRKLCPDDTRILDVFQQALNHAEKKRAAGSYEGTSPRACLFRVRQFFVNLKEKGLADTGELKLQDE